MLNDKTCDGDTRGQGFLRFLKAAFEDAGVSLLVYIFGWVLVVAGFVRGLTIVLLTGDVVLFVGTVTMLVVVLRRSTKSSRRVSL